MIGVNFCFPFSAEFSHKSARFVLDFSFSNSKQRSDVCFSWGKRGSWCDKRVTNLVVVVLLPIEILGEYYVDYIIRVVVYLKVL